MYLCGITPIKTKEKEYPMRKQGSPLMRITQRTPDGKKYIPDDPIKFDVAKHTIDKINPIPFIPNETVNQKVMAAEFIVTELYLECLTHLITSGKVYDIEQFRQDFLSLVEKEGMKSKLEILITELF